MECPFNIEPHQIQGLDYITIFPVVKWLVKKVIETRQNEGDEVRAFAVNQYHQHNKVPIEDPTINGIVKTSENSRPKRVYRRKDGQDPDVDLTLAEYGYIKSRGKSTDDKKHEGLLKGTREMEENLSIASVTVGQFLDKESLSMASEKYTELRENMLVESNPNAILETIKVVENQKETIKERLKAAQEESKTLQPLVELSEERTSNISVEVDKLTEEISNQKLSDEREELLSKLQKMVAKNETLKQKESEFKEQCRQEMEALMKENETLENELKRLKGEKVEVSKEEEEADLKLLGKIKKKLIAVNQQVQLMERQIDAIPSRAELAQYQKRFVELEDQVSAEYCETQKFIIMYNTLREQLLFMEKEVKLLNSIYDGIPDAKLSSNAAKTQFRLELEQIHTGVQLSKGKIDKIFLEQESTNNSVNQELNSLNELQRNYSFLIQKLSEEMTKNENLTNKTNS